MCRCAYTRADGLAVEVLSKHARTVFESSATRRFPLYNILMTTKKAVNLEKSLADLETLIEELESGDLPLEKAMKKFEEGIKLTRGCQTALKEAEQKVEILLKSAGGEALEAFDIDDD